MSTEYRKLLNQGQETVFEAAREWTRIQERALSDFRAAGAAAVDRLPAPAEVIEANYDFATRLLELQKESALRWVDATTSASPADHPRRPKPASSAKE